jgi:hypothetical protein
MLDAFQQSGKPMKGGEEKQQKKNRQGLTNGAAALNGSDDSLVFTNEADK